MVDVRVGIVSWNTSDWLDRCLRALPTALGDLEAEVVVVDNDSADGSAEVAAGFDWVELRRSPTNVGYARAMNAALAGTDAPALIALNPDTDPPPASLERLVIRLADAPRAGLVAPRLLYPDGTPQHSVYRFPTLPLASVVNLVPAVFQRGPFGQRWCLETAAAPAESCEVGWAIGAVHCIRRRALDGQAPYREEWFMYVEDLDLCWRLHHAGWATVYEPNITVVHAGNAAGEQAWGADRTRRWLEATYDWYRRERGPGRARTYAALNLLGATTKAAGLAATSMLGGPKRPARRLWARELAATVPTHLRAVSR